MLVTVGMYLRAGVDDRGQCLSVFIVEPLHFFRNGRFLHRHQRVQLFQCFHVHQFLPELATVWHTKLSNQSAESHWAAYV